MFKNVLVISDNAYLCKEFFNIVRNKKLNDTSFSLGISPFSKTSDFDTPMIFDLKIQSHIDKIKNDFDLILSIHCKQIFPSDLVNTVKCINVHPGYNPINRGWFPQVFAIINELPIGATIHEIDDALDHGAIIARSFVNKENHDTSLSLYNKIIKKELELLDSHLESIIENTYESSQPEIEGTLYLKKDFNDLLKLDLNEQTSIGDLINRLRALTHGDFNNAYYLDPDTGKKIFVGIKLKPENDE